MDLLATMPKEMEYYYAYALSQYVIHGILCMSLGPFPPSEEIQRSVWKWVYKHIHFGDHETPFLMTASKAKEEQILHWSRVVELGELLYNLQGVPNIHEQIYQRLFCDLKAIESTMLELEALRLLWLAEINFRLHRSPNGKQDYDCEIKLADEFVLPCELKCKIEGTQFSHSAITGPLEHARNKQLPKGGCGIVILKIPSEWGSSNETVSGVKQAIKSVLRNTSRIGEVIVYQRILTNVETRAVYGFTMYNVVNEKHPQKASLGAGIFGSKLDWLLESGSDAQIAMVLKTRWLNFSMLTDRRLRALLESELGYHEGQ